MERGHGRSVGRSVRSAETDRQTGSVCESSGCGRAGDVGARRHSLASRQKQQPEWQCPVSVRLPARQKLAEWIHVANARVQPETPRAKFGWGEELT